MFYHRAAQLFTSLDLRTDEKLPAVQITFSDTAIYQFATDGKGRIATPDKEVVVDYEIFSTQDVTPINRPYVFLSELTEDDEGSDPPTSNPDRVFVYTARVNNVYLMEEDIRQIMVWLIVLDQYHHHPDKPVRYATWNYEGDSGDVYDASVIPLPCIHGESQTLTNE